MTPISAKSDLPDPAGRRTRRVDLAARLKGRVRTLRAQLERRETLVEAIREANATLEPRKVAGWLVHQARSWIPSPCWVVIARNENGDLAVIAEEGLTGNLTPALWVAAHWVMRHGAEFLSADLGRDSRTSSGAVGSAIAFPLVCRHRTVGVLVGLDSLPSASVPSPVPSSSAMPPVTLTSWRPSDAPDSTWKMRSSGIDPPEDRLTLEQVIFAYEPELRAE